MTELIKNDSRFIHAEDLLVDGKWGEMTLTIKKVGARGSMKSLDGKVIDGFPLAFDEDERFIILNKTNRALAVHVLGTRDPSMWVGRKLTFYPSVGDWFGQKNVSALRIRVPAGMPRPFILPSRLGKDLTRLTK